VKQITPVTNVGDEVILVPARAAHVMSIAGVWHDGWRDGHLGHVPEGLVAHRSLPEFERRARDRLGQTTVAVAPGEPDGLAGFVVTRGDEVEQLYVAAPWRGTAVAARLLAHAERHVATEHAVAWLAVVDGNARARRFYERSGWVDRGAFDNVAEISNGTMLVAACRYEKALRGREVSA
jgi:GNAT superfamily N-acetyltransferase